MFNRGLTSVVVYLILVAPGFAHQAADSNRKLAPDFWSWRARYGQYTSDDVPRMERPSGAVRDWSAASVEGQRKELAAFDERWRNRADKTVAVSQQVDHRLIGSALARVHWELDILRRWQRDPGFYIVQTLTPVGEALILPTPYDEKQSREIMSRLNNIPEIHRQAQQNLVSPPSPFAKMAIDSLVGIRPKLEQVATTLAPQTTIAEGEWQASAEKAATSRGGIQGMAAECPAKIACAVGDRTRELHLVPSKRGPHAVHAGRIGGSC